MAKDQSVLKESGFFTIDQAQLEYEQYTPLHAAGLTLVLLHEGLGCVTLWKDFPQQLATATGCRVLAYSRTGYGGSDPCPLPRPLSFMHDEALRVLPKLLNAAAVDQALLIGHSDGASIALINAGGSADPRVQGLILLAPHVFVEELTLASIQAASNAYHTSGLRERLGRYHADVDSTFLGWSQAWLDPGFTHWNLEAYLPQIKIPVLLLQGEQDNYGTHQQLERIATQLPQKPTQILLPDCGHAPFRDQPALTLAAITSFVQNHPPNSAGAH